MIPRTEEGLSGEPGEGSESLWVLAYVTFVLNVISVFAISVCSWLLQIKFTRELMPPGTWFFLSYLWALFSFFLVPVLFVVELVILLAYRSNGAFRTSGLRRAHSRSLAAALTWGAIVTSMTCLNW